MVEVQATLADSLVVTAWLLKLVVKVEKSVDEEQQYMDDVLMALPRGNMRHETLAERKSDPNAPWNDFGAYYWSVYVLLLQDKTKYAGVSKTDKVDYRINQQLTTPSPGETDHRAWSVRAHGGAECEITRLHIPVPMPYYMVQAVENAVVNIEKKLHPNEPWSGENVTIKLPNGEEVRQEDWHA